MRSHPGQLTQVLSAKLWTRPPTAQTGFSLLTRPMTLYLEITRRSQIKTVLRTTLSSHTPYVQHVGEIGRCTSHNCRWARATGPYKTV